MCLTGGRLRHQFPNNSLHRDSLRSSNKSRMAVVRLSLLAVIVLLSSAVSSNGFYKSRQLRQIERYRQAEAPVFGGFGNQRFGASQQLQALPRQGAAFNCPERNGYFANPGQCDAYYKCVDGVASEELCPDGLLFKDGASPFTYPCQYPNDVDCLGRGALQPAQPTEQCPHQYGYFKVGDSANCGQFVNCAAGRGYVLDCPDGLAFDERTYHCDWPDMVPSCDAETYLAFRCPEESRLFNQGEAEFRYFRSPTDCQKYFICVDGRPRRFNCGEGRAYNELIGACDGAENVTGCAIPVDRRTARLNQNF